MQINKTQPDFSKWKKIKCLALSYYPQDHRLSSGPRNRTFSCSSPPPPPFLSFLCILLYAGVLRTYCLPRILHCHHLLLRFFHAALRLSCLLYFISTTNVGLELMTLRSRTQDPTEPAVRLSIANRYAAIS